MDAKRQMLFWVSQNSCKAYRHSDARLRIWQRKSSKDVTQRSFAPRWTNSALRSELQTILTLYMIRCLRPNNFTESDVANHPDQVGERRDLLWLMEIERELLSAMRPKSKFDRIVLAEIAIEAGLTLIKEAETAKKMTALSRARMVRNGLMIALLAHYPIRLATREHQSVVFTTS